MHGVAHVWGYYMAFVDYTLLSNKYQTGKMAENLQLIIEFDIFHCLLAGSDTRANAVKSRISGLPNEFLSWLEVCDGGLLFDTTMLTTKTHDAELGLDFYTYGDFSNAEVRQELKLSEDWFVFAIAVHSDVFFFNKAKMDGKVYQWDVEEEILYAEWSTFEDWLSDQIQEAIEQIADDNILPLSIKMVIDNE